MIQRLSASLLFICLGCSGGEGDGGVTPAEGYGGTGALGAASGYGGTGGGAASAAAGGGAFVSGGTGAAGTTSGASGNAVTGGSTMTSGGTMVGFGGVAGVAGSGANPVGGAPATAGAAGAGGGAAGGTAGANSGGSAGEPTGPISISGRQLRVGGRPFEMRGVCWNPVTKGAEHPAGIDFAGLGAIDIPLMQAANINVVRTYEAIRDRDVLDRLFAANIRVVMMVYAWGGAAAADVASTINAVKDHPAVLMWLVGNEWNYNGLYVGLSFDDSLARVNEVVTVIKQNDTTHPVATAYGELPSEEVLSRLSAIDVWGLNVYRGISFGNLFSDWSARSTKPMFIAEYGADAFDARIPGPNLEAQALADEALTGEILARSAADGGDCLGGTIFEWSDEWWKAGNPAQHDNGGSAPGGGPYPDATFNEEWWGIVDIDRNVRPAYTALSELWRAR